MKHPLTPWQRRMLERHRIEQQHRSLTPWLLLVLSLLLAGVCILGALGKL